MKPIIAVILFSLTSARAQEIFIRASQVGYAPQGAKIAIAFSKSSLPEKFTVEDGAAGKVCFTGKALPITGTSWGQFTNHAELDFSAFVVEEV